MHDDNNAHYVAKFAFLIENGGYTPNTVYSVKIALTT